MVQSLFLNILGIIGCIILLYLGMKLSKYKPKQIKIGGYFLIILSTIGLLVDLYSLIHNHII
jgi:hypothetical protein